MLQRYRGYGLRSAYMIFAMSDETFSITCSAEPPEGVDRGWFMFFITLLDQIYWVASAAMGADVYKRQVQRGGHPRRAGADDDDVGHSGPPYTSCIIAKSVTFFARRRRAAGFILSVKWLALRAGQR